MVTVAKWQTKKKTKTETKRRRNFAFEATLRRRMRERFLLADKREKAFPVFLYYSANRAITIIQMNEFPASQSRRRGEEKTDSARENKLDRLLPSLDQIQESPLGLNWIGGGEM